MAGKNKVEQRVSLNIAGYEVGIKKLNQAHKQATEDSKRNSKEQAKNYEDAAEKIKKKNLELGRSLRDVSKEFGKNLWNGTVVTAGTAGVAALKSTYEDAAKSVLTLDQSMARMISRYDLSKEKAKSLRKELQLLGTQTGITGGELGEAADVLMSASKNREAVGIGSIGQFAAMGGGDPKEIARTVVDHLKGSGQQLTEGSVKDLLTSVTSISRGGDLSLTEALQAISTDSISKAKLNLSNKENAALIAAASGVGQNRGNSIAGLNAVLQKSVGGFGEGATLAGILGVGGGSFLKDGKFDVSKLQEASTNLNSQGLSKADFTKLLESTGLREEEAEGLYSILKDFDQFEKSFKGVLSDQKTLEESFSQSTDNIYDAFKRLSEKIAKGATEIISPLGEVGKDILDGNFAKALGKTPGALAESGGAVMDNKAVVAMGLGATLLTGLLAGKIGKILGGATGGSNLASGTAMGMALKQAGVTPVYVVNAADIRSEVSTMPSAITDLLKGPGAGGVLKKAGLGMLGKAGLVGAAGAVGYGAGTLINEYGPTFEGKTKEGFEGGVWERLFFKLDKLLGGEGAANIQKAQKLQLEVIDNGERLTVKPKASDLARNNIGN